MKTFELSNEIAAAIDVAGGLLADAVRFDEALERNAQDIDGAKAAHDAALALRTALDTRLALATDEGAASAIETKVKKASADVDAARSLLDRRERVGKALTAEREKSVDALKAEIGALGVEIQTFAQAVSELVAQEIRGAVAPLVAVLRKAWVLEMATQRGWLRNSLSEINIPVPGQHGSIIQGERSYVDGPESKLLSAGWQDDPSLVETHRLARAPMDTLRKLNAYMEDAKLSPKQRRELAASRARAAEERAAMIAAGEADAAAAAARRAAPPRMPGRTVEGTAAETRASRAHAAAGGQAPVEMNVGAHALADEDFAQFR